MNEERSDLLPLRPARPEDRPAIEALVGAAYGHYVARMGRKPMPMVDDYGARIAEGEALVLEEGGRLVALLVLEEEPGVLLLDNVAVDPAQQKRGLGRRLLAYAEAEARRRGFPAIRLYTSEMMVENIAIYRKLGWTETGRSSEHGIRRVNFRKDFGGEGS